MYEIDVLINYKWEWYASSNNINDIDKAFLMLVNEKPGIQLRYMECDRVLSFMHATAEDYVRFRTKYLNDLSDARKLEQVRKPKKEEKQVEKTFEEKVDDIIKEEVLLEIGRSKPNHNTEKKTIIIEYEYKKREKVKTKKCTKKCLKNSNKTFDTRRGYRHYH